MSLPSPTLNCNNGKTCFTNPEGCSPLSSSPCMFASWRMVRKLIVSISNNDTKYAHFTNFYIQFEMLVLPESCFVISAQTLLLSDLLTLFAPPCDLK